MKHTSQALGRAGSLPILSRRMLLVGSTALLSAMLAARHIQAHSVPQGSTPEPPFMLVSRLLIAHRLDPGIGRRIAAEMKADQPPLSSDIDRLIELARSRNATQAEDFFPLADEAAKASALRIISAWYLGVVDNVPGSTVIAYELALMFQPTSDVMTIPTYAISGPNGWGSQAPKLSAMPVF